MLQSEQNTAERGLNAGTEFFIVERGNRFRQVQTCLKQSQQFLAKLQQRKLACMLSGFSNAGGVEQAIDCQYPPTIFDGESNCIRFAGCINRDFLRVTGTRLHPELKLHHQEIA